MALGRDSRGERAFPFRLPSADVALSLAGPALIVILVLVLLHDVVFGGRVSGENPDLLSFWMPNQCLLGEELMSGRIPYWNPHSLAGVPFAADPQSGWMYAPMMVFSALPCDVSIRALIVLFPLLAGLGGYAFVRGEGLTRTAATVTGLCAAGFVAGSALAVTLTFAGFVGWSPWMLTAASRALRAPAWSGRLAWVVVTALLWGQLAAAHLGTGAVMGSALLLFFSIYKAATEIRAGRLTAAEALSIGALAAVLIPLANLAYLLPRLIYMPRSTFGLGYEGLFELRRQLWGTGPPQLPPSGRVAEPVWILRIATSPGAYLGALPLALTFGGLFVARLRVLALTLWVYVLLFYALSTSPVAGMLQSLIGDTFLGQVYGHAPARFGYAPILGLCLLAGIGAEAWRMHGSVASRLWLIAPGAVLWGVAPFAAGVIASRMLLVVVAAVIVIPLLLLSSRQPALWPFLGLLLAAEFGFNGLHGQSRIWEHGDHGLTDPTIVGVEPMPEPDIETRAFAHELPLLEPFDSPPQERWLTLTPSLQLLGRQMIHRLNEVQGYNPVQLRRYWTYSRAFSRAGVYHSPRLTRFRRLPGPVQLDLLQVGYVATPPATPPRSGFTKVGTSRDGWTIWEVPDPSPAASFFRDYESVPSPEIALNAVLDPSFDPSRDLVIERDGLSSATSDGAVDAADVEWLDANTAEVTVSADMGGFLLVRIPYDDHWTASIDGRQTPVLPADYFLQAAEVPPGEHVVRLVYRDPWVMRGFAGSAAVLATVVAAALWMRRRTRQDRSDGSDREVSSSTRELRPT